jgi:putative ABC transport system permease protein
MRAEDVLRFGGTALRGARTRTWLMLLAMAIGVGSVVVLTALGDGARRYVVSEFANLGTNLLVVIPGKIETTGSAPPLIGGTPDDLTLEDTLALQRSSSIRLVAPVALGSAPVSFQQLEREATIVGSTAELLPVRNLEMAQGKFLPKGDPTRGGAVAVIGEKLRKELFGSKKVLGEWVRIHDRRYRVIGVLKPMGQSLGLDVGELAVIPVSHAHSLFNTTSLFRILVQANGTKAIPKAEKAITDILKQRHNGEEDFTVITQNALLSTFDDIFKTLTFTVSGIAAISLGVAGILIMNVMLVAVSQRTAEIGKTDPATRPGGSRSALDPGCPDWRYHRLPGYMGTEPGAARFCAQRPAMGYGCGHRGGSAHRLAVWGPARTPGRQAGSGNRTLGALTC